MSSDPAGGGSGREESRTKAALLEYHTLLKRLHAYADRLDLPIAVTSHIFRRSCTTKLIRSGANLWHAKDLLGHEHLDTLQHYSKSTITDLKRTHAKLHPRERES